MKSQFDISIILFSVAIFLGGCGSGLNTVSIDSDKTIKFKTTQSTHPSVMTGNTSRMKLLKV